MTDKEIFELMLDCGLMPTEKLEWSVDHYVSADNFIEGDKAAILQFAREIIKRVENDCKVKCRG